MPRSTVEPGGFYNQGAPRHLPTPLITIQLLALNIFCEESILAQHEAGQVYI